MSLTCLNIFCLFTDCDIVCIPISTEETLTNKSDDAVIVH